MRKKILLIFLVCTVFFLNAEHLIINAQTEEEELVGLLQRLLVLTATLHSRGYTIVHIEVDKLYKGSTYTTSRKLFDSNVYKIVGMGGIGVKDLDLALYDYNNNLIAEDKKTDNIPELEVEIYKTSVFKLVTKLYSLEERYSSDDEYFFLYLIAFKRR